MVHALAAIALLGLTTWVLWAVFRDLRHRMASETKDEWSDRQW